MKILLKVQMCITVLNRGNTKVILKQTMKTVGWVDLLYTLSLGVEGGSIPAQVAVETSSLEMKILLGLYGN